MTVLINGVEYVPAFRPKPLGELGTFGNALRMARKQSRLSLDKAAELVGCSKSFLWELEKDKAEPGLKLAYRLSDAYGIPLLVLALLAQAEPTNPIPSQGTEK